MKPYIGITGATTPAEIEELLSLFDDQGITMQSRHIPMIGILASYKTLHGQHTNNRRYPAIPSIPQLTAAIGNKALAMLHYNSRELSTLADQVEQLMDDVYTNSTCRALQLNIPWPPLQQTCRIFHDFPDIEIVLQLSRSVLEGKTKEISRRMQDYAGLVSYVLIDPSGGKGEEFNMRRSVELYWAIREALPGAMVGFAGGFSDKNTFSRVKEIYQRIGTTDFCIDTEGGIRDKLSAEYGDDVLNFEKAERYACQASKALEELHRTATILSEGCSHN
ncbi:MAG: hypothetical protein V1725_06630 [archaeon]